MKEIKMKEIKCMPLKFKMGIKKETKNWIFFFYLKNNTLSCDGNSINWKGQNGLFTLLNQKKIRKKYKKSFFKVQFLIWKNRFFFIFFSTNLIQGFKFFTWVAWQRLKGPQAANSFFETSNFFFKRRLNFFFSFHQIYRIWADFFLFSFSFDHSLYY